MPNPLKRIALLHPLQRVAVVLWAALLIAVAGRVLFAPVRSHTVVPIYLTAAERWVHGEDLYESAPPLDVYRNPPGFAAAFVPLSILPERLAGLVWRGLSAALFLAGLAGWVRHGLPRPLTPGESGAVFALAAIPAISNVNNGQTNLAIVGMLLLGATAAARERGFPSGVWLALAAATKVYPVAVGLLLCVGTNLRVYPWLVAGLAAAVGLPFLLQDPTYVAHEYWNFLVQGLADDRSYAAIHRAPQDLFLVLRVWAAPPGEGIYQLIQLGVAAGMATLVALAAWRTGNCRACSALGLHLGCAWITVLGPATEPQTYIILGPTAAALLVLAISEGSSFGARARLFLSASGYGLLILPILRDMFPNGKPFHALALQPIGGLFVLAAALWTGVELVARGRLTVPAADHGSIQGDRFEEKGTWKWWADRAVSAKGRALGT